MKFYHIQDDYIRYLRKYDTNPILKTATNLHNLIMTSDEQLSKHDLAVKQRCCNLSILEKVYEKYKK